MLKLTKFVEGKQFFHLQDPVSFLHAKHLWCMGIIAMWNECIGLHLTWKGGFEKLDPGLKYLTVYEAKWGMFLKSCIL